MRTGHLVIGLAAAVGLVPASLAQHGKPAGTGSNTPVFVAVPSGGVSVRPEVVDGEPVYVRRTTVAAGMTIVEVSTTPFMPVLPSEQKRPEESARKAAEQPASW